MKTLEIVVVALMILAALVSLIVSNPMRKHLLAQKKIKTIGLLQMPFYLKDYYMLMNEANDISLKSKYRGYFIIFLVSNLSFFILALVLVLMPGSSF